MEPIDDDAAPPSVDAGTRSGARGDDLASDEPEVAEQEMSEREGTPNVSSSGCSVARSAAAVTHARGAWGLYLALIGLFFARSRARSRR